MARIAKARIGFAAVVALGASVALAAQQGAAPAAKPIQKPPAVWQIDTTDSNVTFSLSHFVLSRARGRFNKFTGNIAFDPANLTLTKVDVKIDAASIDTGNDRRDSHLRNPDFFEVEKYPDITFVSTKIDRSSEHQFRVTGNLTMHGVTKEVVLDTQHKGWLKDDKGRERAVFVAKATINRLDYGIMFNTILESGGLELGEWVDIEIDTLLMKQPLPQPAPSTSKN
jgi:polyisoprenoid-binding protein YceI